MTERTQPAVLVLYNLPRDQVGAASACTESDRSAYAEADQGVLDEVESLRLALARRGIPCHVAGIRRLADLPALLGSRPERIVFNLVESLEGAAGDFNDVPAVCRSWGRSCTGSDSRALAASLDKWQSKALLAQAGLDVPAGMLVRPGEWEQAGALPKKGPWIVKPAAADASEGITTDSIVTTASARPQAIARIHAAGQAALVEQYIYGRELNVSLIQRGGELVVLPVAEIDLSALPAGARIVDYAAKWLPESDAYRQTPRIIPAKLPAAVTAKVFAAAKRAWAALDCRDYARVDFRLDSRGRAFVLEVNTNPDISPDAGFAAALAAGGVAFDQFVQAVVDNAAARLGEGVPSVVAPPRPVGPQGQFTIRASAAADRDAILDMLARTRFFRPDELEIAREVLDDALAQGPGGDYQSYTVAEGARPLGWVCWGATPCCLGTYDMYWIVVDPAVQSRGLGKMLVAHCEQLLRRAGGRLLVIETSSRSDYLPTRRFYLRCGYFEAARVADFYADGDDKVMYTKYLQDM